MSLLVNSNYGGNGSMPAEKQYKEFAKNMKSFKQYINEAKEFILWGVPKGKKGQLNAVVLYTQGKNKADIDRITKLAAKDGWHSFTTQILLKGGFGFNVATPFDIRVEGKLQRVVVKRAQEMWGLRAPWQIVEYFSRTGRKAMHELESNPAVVRKEFRLIAEFIAVHNRLAEKEEDSKKKFRHMTIALALNYMVHHATPHAEIAIGYKGAAYWNRLAMRLYDTSVASGTGGAYGVIGDRMLKDAIKKKI